MSEVMTESVASEDSCPSCAKTAMVTKENDEVSFAFLLAIVPVLTITFFGQVGLL
jgi:nitrate reductase NapE component